MNTPSTPHAQEVELKLALPATGPAALLRQLSRVPALARRKATTLQLHNVYYDTPEQTLRDLRVALRLRRVGSAATPQWLQTLKVGGAGDSALSQRGEWETPVAGPALSSQALQATPWTGIDLDGRLFDTLTPCFETSFERTRWVVRQRDGSAVEVALDRGHITAGGHRLALCELELELLAGSPEVLFALAGQIAERVAVLPLSASKSERAYALAQHGALPPRRARPPTLTPGLAVAQAAQRVLREAFDQFVTNLHLLAHSDDPEVVHQARVGWRRFRSLQRLFKPVLRDGDAPTWLALQPLCQALGELRDLDVARTDTLAPLADAFVRGSASRQLVWQTMLKLLTQAARQQRLAVRHAITQPSVGACLLATTQWLESLAQPETAILPPDPHLSGWARRRLRRLHQRLQGAMRESRGEEDTLGQHRARILAKHLRYGIEALGGLWHKPWAHAWQQQAVTLQGKLGAMRDLARALELMDALGVDPTVIAFLRGVAVGRIARG
ncbi:MAG: CYTH and CHAD domain-containing protein [Rhodoferax sp.]|nr:CYTH and CHAD domain-containing protein [Rhodoferax sp.]